MAETITSSTHIEAEPQRVFDLVVDFEGYPDRDENVESTEVLDVDGDGLPRRVAFAITSPMKTLEYELEFSYDRPSRVEWDVVPGGDMKVNSGHYVIEPVDDGSDVTYTLTLEPAFKLPGFVLRRVQRHVVDTVLDTLKDAAEEEAV